MLERSFSAVELLYLTPELGRRGRISGTRELGLRPSPFILAYRIRRNRIDVVALLHGAHKRPDRL